MDATSTIRTALAVCATVVLMSCGIEQPEQTQPPEPIEFTGYDFTNNAGQALQELQLFLHSVTTTTTVAAMQHSSNAATPAPQDGSVWDELAQCETGGNWATNTGNGFGGGLQFAHQQSWSTWRAFGGEQYAPHPWDASREQQIEVAEQVLQSSGWGAWPGCARKLGLL